MEIQTHYQGKQVIGTNLSNHQDNIDQGKQNMIDRRSDSLFTVTIGATIQWVVIAIVTTEYSVHSIAQHSLRKEATGRECAHSTGRD